jgi:flavin-binding protein dodecin
MSRLFPKVHSNHPDSAASKENSMSVTKVIELSASSSKGIEDAVRHGLEKAGKTVKNIRGAWINDIKIATDKDGGIKEWRVNMRINFEVD